MGKSKLWIKKNTTIFRPCILQVMEKIYEVNVIQEDGKVAKKRVRIDSVLEDVKSVQIVVPTKRKLLEGTQMTNGIRHFLKKKLFYLFSSACFSTSGYC